jgi:hypothetical protein
MLGLIAAFAAALAATSPAGDPDNTISPLDVPGATFEGVEMAKPDRDPDRVVCRYESQPDTHFKKRSCAVRRDRDALERREHEYLMVYQRGFCGGGEIC